MYMNLEEADDKDTLINPSCGILGKLLNINNYYGE
jgi:hypothetical protein